MCWDSTARARTLDTSGMVDKAPGLAAHWLTEVAGGLPGGEQTLELVAATVQPAIAHHSARTFRYAAAIAQAEGTGDVDPSTLFHACLLHDLGATAVSASSARFEVAGADAAAEVLSAHGYSLQQRHDVWAAIALHTSPQIAERTGGLVRLVRLGVRADFGDDLIDPLLRQRTERDCPRLDVERVLSAMVVAQCLADPHRAPASSWPAALLAAHTASGDPDARMSAF